MEQQKQMIAEVKQAELDNLSKNGPPAKKQRRVHKVDISRVVKKMTQLLISHKFQSGLHSHMKLHTSQLQHVQSLAYFQLNLTKNMEMPVVLKKGF